MSSVASVKDRLRNYGYPPLAVEFSDCTCYYLDTKKVLPIDG